MWFAALLFMGLICLLKRPFGGSFVLTLLVLFTCSLLLFFAIRQYRCGIGDAYVMAIAMMYGVSPCIMATFFQTIIISICGQHTRGIHLKLFSTQLVQFAGVGLCFSFHL